MSIFRLIVNGDRDHALSRGFSWSGDARDWLAKLRANGYVSTVDVEHRLRGNDPRTLEPIIELRRVYTRDGADFEAVDPALRAGA